MPAEPMPWRVAELRDAWLETRTVRTLRFSVPGWPGHVAGQHVDVRLTAEDGYTARRDFSIASASTPDSFDITVQSASGGEVSPYLVDEMRPGDLMEVRGPIGGWFRWEPAMPGPVLLVAGGSGVVPLMSMIRQRIASGSTAPFHLVYLARTPDHIIYTNEVHSIAQQHPGVRVDRCYSRAGLPDDDREPGRLRPQDLPGPGARVYVCGPTGFVEHAAALLQAKGHADADIRTERFG